MDVLEAAKCGLFLAIKHQLVRRQRLWDIEVAL